MHTTQKEYIGRRFFPMLLSLLMLMLILDNQDAASSILYKPDLQISSPDIFAADIFSADVNRGLTLDPLGTMVYWVSTEGCPGDEFPTICKIFSKPTGGGLTRLIFDNASGARSDDIDSNLAVDALDIYWLGAGGGVMRLPRAANADASPVTLVFKEVTRAHGEIAVSHTFVYWTENMDNTGKLFRAPNTGGTRQLMTSSTDSDLRQMKVDGVGGVLYIANINAFLCCIDLLHRITQNESGGFETDFSTSSFIHTYTTDDTHVYWATTAPLNKPLHFEAAPLSDLSNVIQGIEADGDNSSVPPSTALVSNMAVDDENLYWHYKASEHFSAPRSILRLNLLQFTGGTPQALITLSNDRIVDLASNGRYLFWYQNHNIFRLSTNTVPIQLDVSIAAIEITQGIQNLSNDVPLVQERLTTVRVYPALTTSSVDAAPAVVRLYGERDGVPLPGSPLTPRRVLAKVSGSQRALLADTANFVLPDSWLSGSLTLRAEINVHGWFDTNGANNRRAVPAMFVPKANACIKFMPVQTHNARIYDVEDLVTGRPNPGFQSILRRFHTLWPVPHVPFYTQILPLLKPQFLGSPQPFNMLNAADSDFVIGALWEHNVFDSAPHWCGGNNARTHYVAMINPIIDTSNILGTASLSEPLMWVKMSASGHGFDAPQGGTTLAHEIAHTYNGLSAFNSRWQHVACGTPAGDPINSSYPYSTDSIGPSGSDTFWGFDRISRAIIEPSAAADYMSYCRPKWTSDYNWRGAMDATGNLPSTNATVAAGSNQLSAAEILVVYGHVSANETTGTLHKAYRLTAATVGMTQTVNSASTPATEVLVAGTYALQLLSPSSGILVSKTVTLLPGTHHGHDGEAESDYAFFGSLEFMTGAAAVRLMKDGNELERRFISANAPIATISQPSAGTSVSDELRIAWSANDADGDELSYVVQYSADGGNQWQLITAGLNENTLIISDSTSLPGSADARIRVIASDGINTGMATSEAFSVANRAPQALISEPSDGQAFLVQQQVILGGEGLDLEEGYLGDSSLLWQVAGPVTVTGTGRHLALDGLPPGTYSAELTVQDGNNLNGKATINFFISPKRIYDGNAPKLDGFCNDAAYHSDLDTVLLYYQTGEAAPVHFVHASDALYVCFSDLLLGTNADEFVALKIDADNNGGDVLQDDDHLFYLRRDGVIISGHGNGSGKVYDSVPQEVTGAVSQSGSQWSAELQIKESRLGGWNRLVRMLVAHLDRNTINDDTLWPMLASDSDPAAWGLTALGQQAQTIDFPVPPDRIYGELPFIANVTASSGLPIEFTSSTPEICTVGGKVVTPIAAGACILSAAQSGNGSYIAAINVTQTLQVRKASQTVTFAPLPDRIRSASSFSVFATASSGLDVTFQSVTPGVCTLNGTTVTLVGAGTCTLLASQPGNENYITAPETTQSFNVIDGGYFLYLPVITRD